MKGMLLRTESGALIAKDAIVVGDVELGPDANVWFGCVLRGDDEPITVGERTNIQDASVVHVDFGYPTVIGRDVTIGHKAMIHGCEIGDSCLIGMGSILLTGCRIGEGSIIAAGALVGEGVEIPPGSVVMGMPGRVRRQVTREEMESFESRARHYVQRARAYSERGT